MRSAARHKLEVEYGQIMESVKMKVSDSKEETRENRKCAIRDSSEAESNGHWVRERIVHQRPAAKKGFVRAVPKRESPSWADLR